MKKLTAPATYQGGKQRLASQIIDYISPTKDDHFYDLCCGCGAISIELIKRRHPPANITMLDVSDKSILLTGERTKGGISGDRKTFNEEWLCQLN